MKYTWTKMVWKSPIVAGSDLWQMVAVEVDIAEDFVAGAARGRDVGEALDLGESGAGVGKSERRVPSRKTTWTGQCTWRRSDKFAAFQAPQVQLDSHSCHYTHDSKIVLYKWSSKSSNPLKINPMTDFANIVLRHSWNLGIKRYNFRNEAALLAVT